MKYWIEYQVHTGLVGQTVKKEWFPSLGARVAAYQKIMAAGCRILGFGRLA